MLTKIDQVIIKSDTHRAVKARCLKVIKQMINEIDNEIYFVKICENGDIFALSKNKKGQKEVLSVKYKSLTVHFNQVKFTSLDREYNESILLC